MHVSAVRAPDSVPRMDSLDQDVLDRLGRDMGGDAAVARIISMYLGKLAAESSGLHQHADSGDLTALAEDSHRLKSSTAMLGATRLAGILAEIEAASGAGDAGSAARWLAEFDAESSRVERDMRSLESP
jgi:HPt (histidine-containing phosphotransfer) domain-containing protein